MNQENGSWESHTESQTRGPAIEGCENCERYDTGDMPVDYPTEPETMASY